MLIAWLLAVVCVEAITEIIVDSDIFSTIRSFFSKRSGFISTSIAKLINCGYCTSVWVAGGIAWAIPGTVFGVFTNITPTILILDVIVKVFVIHRLSNLWHEFVRRWLDRYPLTFVIHKIGDTNEKRRK